MTFAFDLTVTMGVIVTLVIAIVSWVRSRLGGMDARMAALSERIDRHEVRLTAQDQALNGMPAKDDMHDLRLALSELRGDMREIRAAQGAAAEIAKRQEIVVTRVEQYLLERKG